MLISFFKKLNSVPETIDFGTISTLPVEYAVITALRSLDKEQDKERYSKIKSQLSAVCCGATFSGNRTRQNIVEMSGLIYLDIDDLGGQTIEDVVATLSTPSSPFIRIHKSAGGKGLGLLAIVEKDETLTTPDQKAKYYSNAVKYITGLYPNITFDKQCSDITRLNFYTGERDVLYKVANFESKIIPYSTINPIMEKPIAKKSKKYNIKTTKKTMGPTLIKLDSLCEWLEESNNCLAQTYMEWFAIGKALVNTFQIEDFDIAVEYFKRLSINWEGIHTVTFEDKLQRLYAEGETTITVGTIFKKGQDLGWRSGNLDTSTIDKEDYIETDGITLDLRVKGDARRIDYIYKQIEYLYSPRLNNMNGLTYIVWYGEYVPLTDVMLTAIAREIVHLPYYNEHFYRKSIRSIDVQEYINNIRVGQEYNPIEEFLCGLKTTPPDLKLADVKTPMLDKCVEYFNSKQSPETIKKYLASWLIGVLKNSTGHYYKSDQSRYENILVVQGPQGSGKSLFLNTILRAFPARTINYKTGFSPESKEHQREFIQSAVTFIDEGSIFNKSDIEALKNLTSTDMMSLTPKFANNPIELQNRGTFLLTTNKTEFLQDATGNRRYLTIETGKKCNLSFILNKEFSPYKLLEEIKQLMECGYNEKFSSTETDELLEYNKRNEIRTLEEEIIESLYTPATKNTGVAIPLTALLEQICFNAPAGYKVNLALNKLSMYLHKLGYETHRINNKDKNGKLIKQTVTYVTAETATPDIPLSHGLQF